MSFFCCCSTLFFVLMGFGTITHVSSEFKDKLGMENELAVSQPWVVALLLDDENRYEYFCSGILIANNIVLTSTSCLTQSAPTMPVPIEKIRILAGYTGFNTSNPDTFLVNEGKYDLQNATENTTQTQMVEVSVLYHEKEFHTFPLSERDKMIDIAILKLSGNFTFNDYVKPLCIRGEFKDTRDFKETCRAYSIPGFGPAIDINLEQKNIPDCENNVSLLLNINTQMDKRLQEFVGVMYPWKACLDLDKTDYVTQSFCLVPVGKPTFQNFLSMWFYGYGVHNAQSIKKPLNIAKGWSGSPAIAIIDDKWFAVGVLHEGQDVEPYPQIFTDITKPSLVNWIAAVNRKCQDHKLCQPPPPITTTVQPPMEEKVTKPTIIVTQPPIIVTQPPIIVTQPPKKVTQQPAQPAGPRQMDDDQVPAETEAEKETLMNPSMSAE